MITYFSVGSHVPLLSLSFPESAEITPFYDHLQIALHCCEFAASGKTLLTFLRSASLFLKNYIKRLTRLTGFTFNPRSFNYKFKDIFAYME